MDIRSIGYVVELVGDAQICDDSGVIRVPVIGDQINESDIVSTGFNTRIELEFHNGEKLKIGENTEVLLDQPVFIALNPYPEEHTDKLAELRGLIVESVDLAESESTGAGGNSSISAAAPEPGAGAVPDACEAGVDVAGSSFSEATSSIQKPDTRAAPDAIESVLTEADFETIGEAASITDRGEATAQNNSAASATDFSDRSMFSSNDDNLGSRRVEGYSAAYLGNIYTGGDQDWLEVTLAEGENIWLDVDQAALLVKTSIYDASGNIIAPVDNSTDAPWGGFTATSPGTYYVVVEAQNVGDSGNYSLYMTIDVSGADYSMSAMGGLDHITDSGEGVHDPADTEVRAPPGNNNNSGDDTEILVEGIGDDILFDIADDDTFVGDQDLDDSRSDAGDDSLIDSGDSPPGGTGIDIFVLEAGDGGGGGTPAVDTIADFTVGVGGDVLDLSGMLQSKDLATLNNYMKFSYDGVSGDTTIIVDTAGDTENFENTRQIVLAGVDLTANGTLNDPQILDNLLDNGNLIIDQ